MSPDEAKSFVEKLIASGKGDYGRLYHILTTLKQGRRLYDSDQKYLEGKLANEIGVAQKPAVEEGLLTRIQNLINSGTGDTGRLQFILECIQQGKTLYHSDQKYLESKLGSKIEQQVRTDSDNIETLKSQVLLANQKISNLESLLNKKINQLDTKPDERPEKPRPTVGAMPKGWKPADLPDIETVRSQIKTEQERLDKEKTEADLLKIEQSKLMQIILNRQEFEKQVKIEHERLEQQIELERQSVMEQANLVEQIKSQELELEKAKKVRNDIVLQLHHEQARLSSDLQNQKETLSHVKSEYQKISSAITQEEQEIAQAVEVERQRLAEQARVARRIQSEKERLESIRAEYDSVMRAAKSQEAELAAEVKKETARVAQQAKLLKNITRYEKYLASSKEKQSLLTGKIEEQKKKIAKTTSSILQLNRESEMLDNLMKERMDLENQITSASSELEQIQKEKSNLEKQLIEQKSLILDTKKLEAGKIRQLKKRKKELEQGIKKETASLKKMANDVTSD